VTARIAAVALVVPDYDDAIAFFTAIGFEVRSDEALGDDKRWVTVAPPGAETALLLAKAVNLRQSAAIGSQTGGRVGFFLQTDDFDRDQARLASAGAVFEEAPRDEAYGRVAIWRDPFGNRWDLIGPRDSTAK
jgi:catechol 2,3-dioxygenase-like lactoylglutathione lyase family enzyme